MHGKLELDTCLVSEGIFFEDQGKLFVANSIFKTSSTPFRNWKHLSFPAIEYKLFSYQGEKRLLFKNYCISKTNDLKISKTASLFITKITAKF